jgi:anthranilate synthase component 1
MKESQKSLKQVRQAFDQGFNVVSLVREVPEDTITPVEAFLRLTPAAGPSFLLESVEGGERMARYSFLGAKPFETIYVRNGVVYSEGALGRRVVVEYNTCPKGVHLAYYWR